MTTKWVDPSFLSPASQMSQPRGRLLATTLCRQPWHRWYPKSHRKSCPTCCHGRFLHGLQNGCYHPQAWFGDKVALLIVVYHTTSRMYSLKKSKSQSHVKNNAEYFNFIPYGMHCALAKKQSNLLTPKCSSWRPGIRFSKVQKGFRN